MARGIPLTTKVREAIKGWLKKLRITRRTESTPDMSANPKLFLNKGIMGIEGLGEEMAKEFADDLRAILARQLISWRPLSPKYRLYKSRMGLDPRILIATGRYVQSIQALQQPDGSWVVGVPDEPLRPGSKYTLKDLARWLEYGTMHMPPRPHWRPAREIWRTKIYRMKKRLQFDIAMELKKSGWV